MANVDHLHNTEYVQRCSVSRPQGRGLSIASSWGWAGKGRLARAPAVLGFALTGTPGPEESKVACPSCRRGVTSATAAPHGVPRGTSLVFDPALRHILCRESAISHHAPSCFDVHTEPALALLLARE